MVPLALGDLQELISGGLPIAMGAVVVLFARRYLSERLAGMVGRIPPGDILHLAHGGIRLARHAYIKATAKSKVHQINTRRDKLWQSVISLLNRSLQPRIAPPKWAWIGTLWMSTVGLVILAITTG